MAKVKVGITMGDPSGIGPAILVKAISKLRGSAEFLIIGDDSVLRRIPGYQDIRAPGVHLIDLKNVPRKNFSFGKIKKNYGGASVEYLDKAMDLFIARQIDCLVTGPISKQAAGLSGFSFPGQTEYLAQCTGTGNFAMMLLNKQFKFSLLTTHIPLKAVSSRINREGIRKNIALTVNSLNRLFAIKKPRIVVCGLNPHASDEGIIGDEEIKVIKPAIKKLRKSLKAVIDGPTSSDIAILKASRNEYDAVIAIYHDQALIPLKLTGYDAGVNMTLGLPFVRTSPLHGTAFDIAAEPRLANPDSLIEAIKLAIRCAPNLKKVIYD